MNLGNLHVYTHVQQLSTVNMFGLKGVEQQTHLCFNGEMLSLSTSIAVSHKYVPFVTTINQPVK